MGAANDLDVLISGAGPAGVHTALRLARAGHRVGLLDARSFPRSKPCGEFLSPACLPMLDELGLLDALLQRGAAAVHGMDLAAGDRRASGDYVALGPFAPFRSGHGLGIRREVLDHLAVQAAQRQANIRVLLGWRVSGLVQENGRACGLDVHDPSGEAQRLRARVVVGADGLHSRIARSLRSPGPRKGRARFAILARFEGVPRRRRAEVHFVESDYFAACPVDDGLFTANLVVDGDALPKGSGGLEDCFHSRLERAPRLADRLAQARAVEPFSACGPVGAPTGRATAPGVALVGDACGFVDPLTGEGLFYAMRGAALLATSVDAALREPRREHAAWRSYERARRREFGPRYALARLLQRGLRRRAVPESVIGCLGRAPGLCQLILGLTGDYVPPRGIASPRVWAAVARAR